MIKLNRAEKSRILLAFVLLSTGLFFLSSNITGLGILNWLFDMTPSASSELNCSVQLKPCSSGTAVLNLYNLTNSHVALPNQSWGAYALCCEDVAGAYVINTSSSGFEFLKLYQLNNSHVGIPNHTGYNISAYISSDLNISCEYINDSHGNCSTANLTNATCLLTLPVDVSNLSENFTNLHVSDCITPYSTSVCCAFSVAVESYEIVVLIDGNETSNLTNAGEPYNITVVTKKDGVITGNMTVLSEECNGIAPFVFLQYSNSNLTNCGYSVVLTGPDGNASYTAVPTGGVSALSSPFDYNVTFYIVVDNVRVASKTVSITYRNIPLANFSRANTTVNRNNIEAMNQNLLKIFDRVSNSKINLKSAGENFDIVVYDNGTVSGFNNELTSGRPTGLNVTVLNSSSSGISGANIILREDSGLLHWAMIQLKSSDETPDVANYAQGNVSTDSSGNAVFTIVPTGGVSSTDSSIGNYSLNLSVVLPNGSVIMNSFNVNRSLPFSNPTEIVYNDLDIEAMVEKFLRLYDRVSVYVSEV